MAHMSDVEREARQLALEAALRTSTGNLDADGIVAAAAKYRDFLTGTDPE